jgi:outer membrane usher protein
LGALSLAWTTPLFAMPVTVSLLQGDGGALQVKVRAPAGEEPVLHWGGTGKPAPYRLVLAWHGDQLTLDSPLPVVPANGVGPLQAMALRSAPDASRLELQISQAVHPHLRRVGDSWVLRLEPAPAAIVALAPESPIAQVPPPVQMAAHTATAAPTPRPRRLAQAGADLQPDGRVKHEPELLLLDVTINGQRLKDIVRAEQLPGGALLLPADAWQEARLAPLPQAAALSDGSPAYALSSIAGASYKMNRQSLTLEINAPASAFIGSSLGPEGAIAVPPPRPQPGFMLNYDASVAHAAGTTSGGALLEAVAFGGFGNVFTSALLSHDASGSHAARLDSYWRHDFPDRMETLVLGDTVGVGGGWSRPVRYGGVRWGRDFGLRPGFVTLPQISLAGQAALPSTVDVLVNNARRVSQPVQPGPFDLTNVPVITGAGEIALVVRDLLGRETLVTQSYYASPRLLAPGLSDFSFEAGWLRTGYGRDNSYGDLFGAATWRQGLTPSLTGEGRLELQRDRRAAGVEVSGLLGTWAVGRAAVAVASGSTQGTQERGALVQLGVERSTPSGGAAIQYEHASRGFAPFGEAIGRGISAQRARDRWLLGIGGPLWGAISGGASYVRQTRWDGDQVQLLGLSLGMPLWQNASLSFSVNKRLDGDKGWSAAVSISVPLDDGIQTAARAERGTDGKLAGAVTAARNAPAGPGLGWRVQASTTESQRAQAGLQYNTSHAEFALDTVVGADGRVAARAGGRGTVGWLDGMPFASRPVGEGSVAVVKVEGMEGVPVWRANQVVATTDSRGRAFVPGLLPWQKNLIAIDPVDLPLDAQVAETSQEVVPYARSGMVVDFAVKRSRQALLVLHQRGGLPVPVGTKVRLMPAGPEFVAGRRGEVWLTDLADVQQRVQVSWPAGGCSLQLTVPVSADGSPGKIGPLSCFEGRP